MSRFNGGLVGPDGRSRLPAGIVDHTQGADAVELTPEIQKKLDEIFKAESLDNLKARYKLEVAVNEERSMLAPYNGMVVAWTNGGFNHGGGDEAVYFCPALVEKNGETKTCSAPLDLKWVGREAALCPICRNVTQPNDLAGQIGARLTTSGWARLITRIWLLLGGDADIRLGVMPGSLRQRTDDVIRKASLSAGDKLEASREKRRWATYPLKNIIKDTSAGADLQKRIQVFLAG